MRRFLTIISVLLSSIPFIHADTVWKCDFEDSIECSLWTLNPAVNAQMNNKWYIGRSGNFSPNGENGLYISCNGGDSAIYSADQSGWVIAHRSLTVPQGKYQLCFNWRAMGKSTGADRLYVCWVPDADKKVLNSGEGENTPQWVEQYRLDTTRLTLAIGWQYIKIPYTSDGQPGRLVFIWNNKATTVINPPACVDNIEILPEDSCQAPTDIYHTAAAGVVHLGWKGAADYYSIQSYDLRSGQWRVYENQVDTIMDISDLSEGVHSFYIRSHCGDGYSPWSVYTRFIVFAGTRCIDYMCLSDKNCLTGKILGNPDIHKGGTVTANFLHQCVDYGYADKYSRHTVHYMEGEFDPRTNYKVRTIPEGELASVRLGNWNTGAESESVVYDLFVEAGTSDVLRIKYAVVLDSPVEPHELNEQAHFTLQILDYRGRVLDPECSSADFAAAKGNMEGWGYTAGIIDDAYTYYRDWTEIAVSLRQYVGQNIKVQLTTSDCTQGGHFGYAYFTLGCESGELQGMTCGESNTTFTAPDDFRYRWYREDDPDNTLSREQTFHIEPNDTMLYIVDVINKRPNLSGSECSYQLEALGLPRFPVAKATYTHSPSNCTNYVIFNNQSYVRLHNELRKDNQDIVSTIPLDGVSWDFGDGTTSTSSEAYLTHAYPKEGGHFHVVLRAYMSGGKCEDSTIIDLDLPDISTMEHVETKHICAGQSYKYNNLNYFESFSDTVVTRTEAGCDSLYIFQLFVHDQQLQHRDTVVCESEFPIRFNDSGHNIAIDHPGKHVIHDTTRYATDCECESTIEWNVLSDTTLQVLSEDTVVVCPDDGYLTIPYSIMAGRMDSICLRMSAPAIRAGFDDIYCFALDEQIDIALPDTLHAGRYNAMLEFVTPKCEASAIPIVFVVSYPASVLAQKGNNGWVGVLDKEAERYGFVFYQWYRDGKPIQGAHSSYYPTSTDDRGHTYSVRISTIADPEGIMSCPITYGVETALEELTLYDLPYTCKIFLDGQLIIIHQGHYYTAQGIILK
ncbi:MAG: hypothetical protein MJZ88_02050 [Paludibacteraceae bacterium]|nr:hypothetical protein [Paludibacteraceae bacterium]